jgi:predicted RNA-binding protein with PIN domain
MFSLKKVITIAALIAPAFTFGWTANEEGIIELDAHISSRPTQHKVDNAHHLMNLYDAGNNDQSDYIDKQLYDYNNIQIYSKIFIGSEMEEFDMIFDTGSSWVWVGTDKCDVCANSHHFHFK